jgi:hypothetical protein
MRSQRVSGPREVLMRRSRLWPSLLALSLLAAPAGAEIYRVTLNNGQTFDTSYQPQEASWDASMVLLMSDVGNWIGVSKADIQKVEPVNETGSFGVQIAVNTYELGISANDAEAQAEAAALAGGDASGNAQAGADAARVQMLQLVVQQQQLESQQRAAQQKYTVQQFVEPNQTQGIPGSLISNSSGIPPSQQ